jgi:uncharacterized membrane protein (DUF2068 family)
MAASTAIFRSHKHLNLDSRVPAPPRVHVPGNSTSRGLLGWIAVYKLLKAAFMLAAGFATLRLRHRDLTRVLLRWVDRANLDPHSRIATWLLAHVLLIDNRKLSLIGAGFFTYMVLFSIQGIGLYFEKRWAEWFTIATTCLLIPVEIYEFFHRPHFIKVVFVLLNAGVVVYLAWRLNRDAKLKMLAARPAARTYAGPQDSA